MVSAFVVSSFRPLLGSHPRLKQTSRGGNRATKASLRRVRCKSLHDSRHVTRQGAIRVHTDRLLPSSQSSHPQPRVAHLQQVQAGQALPGHLLLQTLPGALHCVCLPRGGNLAAQPRSCGLHHIVTQLTISGCKSQLCVAAAGVHLQVDRDHLQQCHFGCELLCNVAGSRVISDGKKKLFQRGGGGKKKRTVPPGPTSRARKAVS